MTATVDFRPQIAFLLGKPLHRESVLAEVIERLHHRIPTITLHRPDRLGANPAWLYRSQLVVQRGLDADQLDAAALLEQAGIRCCNRIAATRASSNRAHVLASLSAAGVRVPKTSVFDNWTEVLAISSQQALVVKEADGNVGRGQHVLRTLDGVLPDRPPFRGPYVVQEYISNNGSVQKVYMVLRRARGLIKSASPEQGAVDPGVPFEVNSELR